MKNIVVQQIDAGDERYPQLLHFRNKMLRQPLGLDLFSEDLSGDEKDTIIAAFEDGDIVGCVMLQALNAKVLKLRQMAVADSYQGKGLGRILVAHAEEMAGESGCDKIILHARITAQGFYEKLGYEPFGEVFEEVTVPHLAMQKLLV